MNDNTNTNIIKENDNEKDPTNYITQKIAIILKEFFLIIKMKIKIRKQEKRIVWFSLIH